MAFINIPPSSYAVGKATKTELFGNMVNNLEDLNDRVNTISTGANPIELIDSTITLKSSVLGDGLIAYYEGKNTFFISQVKLQIFEKGLITSGTLSVDVLKSSTLGGVYSSLLTTSMSIDFATASDHDFVLADFSSIPEINAGEFVKFRIISTPSIFPLDFRISSFGAV
jgi:hypothetical protein